MQNQTNHLSKFLELFDGYLGVKLLTTPEPNAVKVSVNCFVSLEAAKSFYVELINLTNPELYQSDTHVLARDVDYNWLGFLDDPTSLIGSYDHLTVTSDGKGKVDLVFAAENTRNLLMIELCYYLKDTDVLEGDIVTIDPGEYDPKTTCCFVATRDFKMSELTKLFNSEYEQNPSDYQAVALESGLIKSAPRHHSIIVCNYDGVHVERSGEHIVEFYIDGPDGKSVNQITTDYKDYYV